MKVGPLLCVALAGCAETPPSPPPSAPVPAMTGEPITLAPARRRNVAIVVYPGVELLDFAGPGEVFAANRAFRAYTVGPSHAPIVSQGFVTITPRYAFDDAPKPDVVVIPGGHVGRLLEIDAMMSWLGQAVAADELTVSVCNGALALARLGALDGKHATTHWSAADHLKTMAPRAQVLAEKRYVDEGRVMTTAGVSAGIDGALHIVQRFAGEESAWKTARYMQYAWVPEDGAIPGRAAISAERREAMRAWIMNEWDAAARAYAALVRRLPDDGHARARLGDALVHLGRHEDGLAELARAKALGLSDPETLSEYAEALLSLHRKAEAASALQELAQASEGERPSAYYNQACVLAGMGDVAASLTALRQAVAAGFSDVWSLEHDEDLVPLRGDPAFTDVVAAARGAR